MHLNVLIYLVLGISLGLLYRWAFDASRIYKNLVEQRIGGRNRLPLLNKIASIAIAAGALICSMVLIGADRYHSWSRLILFLVAWVFTMLAAKHVAPLTRK
jgi:hypothetical protein